MSGSPVGAHPPPSGLLPEPPASGAGDVDEVALEPLELEELEEDITLDEPDDVEPDVAELGDALEPFCDEVEPCEPFDPDDPPVPDELEPLDPDVIAGVLDEHPTTRELTPSSNRSE